MNEINLNHMRERSEIIELLYLTCGGLLAILGVFIFLKYIISFSHLSLIGFFTSAILIKSGTKFINIGFTNI